MRLALLLLVLCGGLALTVAYELYGTPRGASPRTPVTQGADRGALQPLPEITYGKKQLYDRVVADNLFSPERRPAPDIGPTGPAQRPRRSAGLPGFALKGIVITPEGRSALIKLDRERDYRKVVKGEIIQGWILESIAADSVTVKKEGTSTVVRLKAPKSSKPRAIRRQRTRQTRPQRAK